MTGSGRVGEGMVMGRVGIKGRVGTEGRLITRLSDILSVFCYLRSDRRDFSSCINSDCLG